MYVSYTKKALNPDLSKVKSLLLYSIDGIGDAVMESIVINELPRVFTQARVTVFCQKISVDFFKRCPFVHDIISINPLEVPNSGYLDTVLAQLAAVKADLALNLVVKPASGQVMLLWASGAPIMSIDPVLPQNKNYKYYNSNAANSAQNTFGMQAAPNAQNITDEQYLTSGTYLVDFKNSLSAVLPRGQGRSLWAGLSNASAALCACTTANAANGTNNAISANAAPVHTKMWLFDSDRNEADKIFNTCGFNPAKTITLAGVSSAAPKDYPYFAESLLPLCKQYGLQVLALGSNAEHERNNVIVEQLHAGGVQAKNLSGSTALCTAAALIEKSLFTVGVDTGLLHMACALKRPHAVLLGCADFGTMWPASPLTSVICLPLSCMHCGYNCAHEHVCIKGLPPHFVSEALEHALLRHYPALAVNGKPANSSSGGKFANNSTCYGGYEKFNDVLYTNRAALYMLKRNLFKTVGSVRWQSPAFIIDDEIAPVNLNTVVLRYAKVT